ncbi:unnamed protein product [Amoebophrya sp. A25]|nr:unnamed protein product [Amoebophrya sp. A25]|eukprot:GSA25T00021766001.1
MGWLDNWKEGEASAPSYGERARRRLARIQEEAPQCVFDFSQGVDIVIDSSCGANAVAAKQRVELYASLFSEEVRKRTLLGAQAVRVISAGGPPEGNLDSQTVTNAARPQISLRLTAGSLRTSADAFRHDPTRSHYNLLDETSEISYRSTKTASSSSPCGVTITAKSCRGLLFGIGRFLRLCRLGHEQSYASKTTFAYCLFPDETCEAFSSTAGDQQRTIRVTKPRIAVRQHQIAYRPKTNAYDAFSVEQMRQQILDCVWFGCNSIEVIPPGLDDADFSPNFGPTDWLEMLREVSDFCDQLDIMVSIWYPAFFMDYSAGPALEAAKKHWELIFSHLPRLDVLFVPGGDPGGHPPEVLLRHIAKEQSEFFIQQRQRMLGTQRREPIFFETWVSTQFGLSHSVDLDTEKWQPREREDSFFDILEKHGEELATKANLKGIVYGPWSSYAYTEFRDRVPSRFRLRRYPDLCHCVGCEFPQQGWSVPLALCHGREPITVRPQFLWAMLKQGESVTDMLGCYSEGVSDDVNKFVALIAAWEGTDEGGDASTRNRDEKALSSTLSSTTETSLLEICGIFVQNDTAVPTALRQGLEEYCRFLCLLWDEEAVAWMTTLLFDMERQDWNFRGEEQVKDKVVDSGRSIKELGGRRGDAPASATPPSLQRKNERFSTFTAFEDVIRPFLDATPRMTHTVNWRMMMLKLRIYYDELVRRRNMALFSSSTSSKSTTTAASSHAASSHASSATPSLRSGVSSPQKSGTASPPAVVEAQQETPATLLTTSSLAQQDSMNMFDSSKRGSRPLCVLPDRAQRSDPFDSESMLYAEVLSVCRLLYAIIGYQTSTRLGGQHRQRGAFADLLWCSLGTTSAGVRDEAGAPEGRFAAYLSVGEVYDDFVLAVPAACSSTGEDARREPSLQDLQLIFPNGFLSTSGSTSASSTSSILTSSSSTMLQIRPVFVAPPPNSSNYNDAVHVVLMGAKQNNSTSSNTSEGVSKDSKDDNNKRKMNYNQMVLDNGKKKMKIMSQSHVTSLVRSAVVDQMYYSQIYETLASDHDRIAAELLPKTRRACLRWGSCVWPTARALYLIDAGTAGTTNTSSAGSGTGASSSTTKKCLNLYITYMGSEAVPLGGDWEELGRETLPTRCVLKTLTTSCSDATTTSSNNTIVLHDFIDPPPKETRQHGPFSLPSSVAEDLLLGRAGGGESGAPKNSRKFLLEFEVRNRKDITFCAVPMPVAELTLVVGEGDHKDATSSRDNKANAEGAANLLAKI